MTWLYQGLASLPAGQAKPISSSPEGATRARAWGGWAWGWGSEAYPRAPVTLAVAGKGQLAASPYKVPGSVRAVGFSSVDAHGGSKGILAPLSSSDGRGLHTLRVPFSKVFTFACVPVLG